MKCGDQILSLNPALGALTGAAENFVSELVDT